MDKSFHHKFLAEYNRLNHEQKLAVDTIEGPVMVIAGAGTGKTQTIAVRIGRILDQTQVNPSNILCLTFTENAALNMRDRLIKLVGPDGYGVRISTFHGFCNSVIKDHPEYFLTSAVESQPIDDITQIEIIRSLIDNLPSSSPLKNFNSPYFHQKDIISSLSSLKKENISPNDFDRLIQDSADFIATAVPVLEKISSLRASKKTESEIVSHIRLLSLNPAINVLYQSRLTYFLKLFELAQISLSQLKQKVKDFIQKTQTNLPKINDLSRLYHRYQEILQQRGLYDYEDMILWVIDAFSRHRDLLSTYQEIYQYILIDEFQDTNSSQMGIINLLVQGQENPNIFVVGDDDQSIFRFQGANIENIFEFYQKYRSQIKRPIVLKNNYRSHQLILDSSNDVISQNQGRIGQYISNIDKSLTSNSQFDPNPINLFVGNTLIEENFWISQKIKQLINTGIDGQDIAVLYRNNADINDLLPFLTQNHISYLRSDSINILETIEIQQLLTLIKYLSSPQDNTLLSHLLSFKFLNFPASELYQLFHAVYSQKLNLSTSLLDQDFLTRNGFSSKFIKKLNRFTSRVAKTAKDSQNLPADELFNIIIRRFGFLKFVLNHRQISLLKQLNTLYSHLKQTLLVEKISLFDWIKKINLLFENKLSLNSSPLISQAKDAVRLMTVHKAKGLEFKHVFLIKVLSSKWDTVSSKSFIKLPLGVVKYDLENDSLEEDRRLFYVALTRAMQQIYLSYTKFNDSQKEQIRSRFIAEINPERIELFPTTPEIESQALLFSFYPRHPKLQSDHLKDYLNEYLAGKYRFNITHLNSYLKCPLCFFFKTIMRLPYPKPKAMSFGSGVHNALAYLTQVYKKDNRLISLDKFLSVFEDNLKKENLSATDFADLNQRGRQILTDYYQHYQSDFSGNCLTEHDFKFRNVRLNNIPLTGKIDKIEFLGGNRVSVVDYKTGKPDSKNQQLSPDGDYFRQLVFYKLLCSQTKSFPYDVVSGTIDFIEKNNKGNFVRKTFTITQPDIDKLKTQITTVFKKITDLDFTPNPDCSDPDHLHYLFEKYFKHEA